jgi:FKBP-type peptidyl-prolyl cis-trans isomerase FklB
MNKIKKENIIGSVQAHRDRTRRRCSVVIAALTGVALAGTCQGAGVPGGDTSGDASKMPNRAGYSAGYAFGGQLAKLQAQEPGVELAAVFQGILDALSGVEPLLNDAEMRAALQSIEQDSAAGKTIPVPRGRFRGYRDDFAALNAKREGVVSLPSGVQYEILQAGTGRQPVAGDAVLVNYQGSLTTGAVFDSTYEDGEPARMQVDEVVVPGLKEALLLMPEGAKWRVVIPPSMGFARSGNNQLRRRDLIYDIELLSVESAAKDAAASAAKADQADAVTGKPAAPPEANQP